MDNERIIKSGQEQAVASWVNYLNQVRLDRLSSALFNERNNLDNALNSIDDALETISSDIINNGKGLGGEFGMHGFIAEAAEYGIGNARKIIEGKVPDIVWLNDNSSIDLYEGAQAIQMKFSNSGNHLSLQAVIEHLHKYPDFLKNGGIYEIPSDHYEKIQWLLSIPESEANKMSTSTGGFSLKQWKEVQQFCSEGEVPLSSIKPSRVAFPEVQRGTYEQTFEKERESLKERNQERRDHAYHESKLSFQEGVKVTVGAAAIEGGLTFCNEVIKKKKTGKTIREFDENDWKEICGNTGFATIKGGVRGVSIYALTNFTATPAAVASSIVTASFGVASQAYLYRKGEIDGLEFIKNSEELCLDVSVSALSSLLGQTLIPVPVLGAVVGNTAGTMMWQIAKDSLNESEQKLMEYYLKSLHDLDKKLSKEYRDYLERIEKNTAEYMMILDKAFVIDVRDAFEGSIELAKYVGLPYEETLKNLDEIRLYMN